MSQAGNHRLVWRGGVRPCKDLALEAQLPPASVLPGDLRAAEGARRYIVDAKDIRSRYTILHFLWDLGVLHEWAEAVLPEVL